MKLKQKTITYYSKIRLIRIKVDEERRRVFNRWIVITAMT
jgi:hypothetical protein